VPGSSLNRFDADFCDPWAVDFLADERAGAVRILPNFAPFFLPASGGDDDLEDFLRDFLDIRLPFVAFGGSIIRQARDSSGRLQSPLWQGKSDGTGVWLQGIRRVPVCSLHELV
jgi:hypothetical protein